MDLQQGDLVKLKNGKYTFVKSIDAEEVHSNFPVHMANERSYTKKGKYRLLIDDDEQDILEKVTIEDGTEFTINGNLYVTFGNKVYKQQSIGPKYDKLK